MFNRAASIILCCLVASSAAAEHVVGQAVNTTSGTIVGHASKIDPSVSEYLGIPWGAPPVGELRFMPPQSFAKSNLPIIADKFSPDCPQTGLFSDIATGSSAPNLSSLSPSSLGNMLELMSNMGDSGKYSEDCLTLNVWTKPQTGEKKKAVLVWIFGGGFTSGSTTSSFTNGVRFAGDQDVILVSINYRVTVMGFPAAPGLPSLNPGFLDQRKAIEWVRDNIEAFGGDPERITIFGQSAGGRSVDAYSFAWAKEKDPIVNGLIIQSGSVPLSSGLKHNPDIWFELSSRLKCGGKEKGNDTVACVRTKTMEEVIAAADTDGGKREDLVARFVPMADDKVYFSDFDKRRAAGNFIQKPMLAGNVDNEAGLLDIVAELRGQPRTANQTRQSNLAYVCGINGAVQGRVSHNIKAWRYRWMGQFPNQKITETGGAWHGSDIPSVFGQLGSAATPDQMTVSKFMNKVWAEFAKDPQNGLLRLGLPQYDKQGQALILFGENNGPNVTFISPEKWDNGCERLKNTRRSERTRIRM